jgi:arginine deiminase
MKAGDPGSRGPEFEPAASAPEFGVFSEVGRLNSVLVCRPGLAHRRLTPHSCRVLEFDAPLWVERAQDEFDGLVRTLQQQGVEVLELHQMLAQTLTLPRARNGLLEATLCADALGFEAADELRQACSELDPARLAQLLLGGMTLADLGLPARGALAPAAALHPFLLAPLPHSMFMREAGSWIQHGVALGRSSRRDQRCQALLAAVYRFHPRFAGCTPPLWWGDPHRPSARVCADGGDIMPLGQGVVLIGVGERTQPQAALQIAQALFDGGAAKAVITAQWPPGAQRPGRTDPLERVFTHCSPEVVTYNADVVDRLTCQELRAAPHAVGLQVRSHAGRHLLDVLSEVLGRPTFHAIPTGADDAPHAYGTDAEPEPWDDGTGVLAVSPGVVIAFDRNTRTNKRLRQASVEVIEVPGGELGRGGATAHGLCCPIARDALN